VASEKQPCNRVGLHPAGFSSICGDIETLCRKKCLEIAIYTSKCESWANAVWPSVGGTGDWLDRGRQPAGQRACGAVPWHGTGPVGQGVAVGGGLYDRAGQRGTGPDLPAVVQPPVHGGSGQPQRCPSAAASVDEPGVDSVSPGTPQGPQRLYDPVEPSGVSGVAPGVSGPARGLGDCRTASGWDLASTIQKAVSEVSEDSAQRICGGAAPGPPEFAAFADPSTSGNKAGLPRISGAAPCRSSGPGPLGAHSCGALSCPRR